MREILIFLAEELNKDIRLIETDMAQGHATDYGDYKYHCGRYRGLLTAKQHIIDLNDRLEREDD